VTEKEIRLVRLAQQGDHRAFGELVAIYDSQVMNLALSLVGSSEDAHDVYQEVFIKVYKSLKNYRFQSEFFTWLYRITVNTCITYRKSRQRKRNFFPTSIEEDSEVVLNQPLEEANNTDSKMMDDELSRVMREAVEQLAPKQRAVVVLRHYQNKKIREIAEIMNLNEGTVKGYLFRALRTLKTKLEPYYLCGDIKNEL
jgi:RNA polymerase sigma-70 factor (ECF subfamily)